MASWDYIDTFFADVFDSPPSRPNYTELSSAAMSALPPMSSAPVPPPAIESYHSTEGAFIPKEPPHDLPPQSIPLPQAQQPAPPSPPKPIFDFVSPFDALISSAPSVKKKPVPVAPLSSSSGNEDSWTSASLGSPNEQKHKSVENLIDQLTRSQVPYGPAQPPSPTYDPYNTTDDYSQVEPTLQPQQSRTMPPPPPLPPKPHRAPSPRASPPKVSAPQQQQRGQGRPVESPVGQQVLPARREKEGSPGPRTGWKAAKSGGQKGKSQSSPTYAASALSLSFVLMLLYQQNAAANHYL